MRSKRMHIAIESSNGAGTERAFAELVIRSSTGTTMDVECQHQRCPHHHPWSPGVYHGEANGQAKLTEDDVRAIRKSAAKEPAGYLRRLSQQFGISTGQIYRIVHREKWKHI